MFHMVRAIISYASLNYSVFVAPQAASWLVDSLLLAARRLHADASRDAELVLLAASRPDGGALAAGANGSAHGLAMFQTGLAVELWVDGAVGASEAARRELLGVGFRLYEAACTGAACPLVGPTDAPPELRLRAVLQPPAPVPLADIGARCDNGTVWLRGGGAAAAPALVSEVQAALVEPSTVLEDSTRTLAAALERLASGWAMPRAGARLEEVSGQMPQVVPLFSPYECFQRGFHRCCLLRGASIVLANG